MVKYVDDVSIVVPVRMNFVINDLQCIGSELKNIYSWSYSNGLTLNQSKTSGLIYSRGQFKQINDTQSSLSDVQFKSSVRFLGVILDDGLRWKSHVDFLVEKCSQRT